MAVEKYKIYLNKNNEIVVNNSDTTTTTTTMNTNVMVVQTKFFTPGDIYNGFTGPRVYSPESVYNGCTGSYQGKYNKNSADPICGLCEHIWDYWPFSVCLSNL